MEYILMCIVKAIIILACGYWTGYWLGVAWSYYKYSKVIDIQKKRDIL